MGVVGSRGSEEEGGCGKRDVGGRGRWVWWKVGWVWWEAREGRCGGR